MLSPTKTSGHSPFCSSAPISVPGAPASSGCTFSHSAVSNPGAETSAPGCDASPLLCTCQPARPSVVRPSAPVCGWPCSGAALAVTGPSAATRAAAATRASFFGRFAAMKASPPSSARGGGNVVGRVPLVDLLGPERPGALGLRPDHERDDADGQPDQREPDRLPRRGLVDVDPADQHDDSGHR